MLMHMQNDRACASKHPEWVESGFSLLEMVVAMLVLSVGLLAWATAIGYGLMASNRGRGVTNSKMLVVSALEQMETLRNTGQLNFPQISNSPVPGSSFRGFPSGFCNVSTVPGPDGVFGTADDLSIDPGPDGNYGTTDDVIDPSRARPNVTRQILITEINPTLRESRSLCVMGQMGVSSENS